MIRCLCSLFHCFGDMPFSFTIRRAQALDLAPKLGARAHHQHCSCAYRRGIINVSEAARGQSTSKIVIDVAAACFFMALLLHDGDKPGQADSIRKCILHDAPHLH